MNATETKEYVEELFRYKPISIGKLLLTWDREEIIEREVKRLQDDWNNTTPDLPCPAEPEIYLNTMNNDLLFDGEWNSLCTDLTEEMDSCHSKDGEWLAQYESGSKYLFDGDFASTFLKQLSLDTRSRFHIFQYGTGFAISITHPENKWIYVIPK